MLTNDFVVRSIALHNNGSFATAVKISCHSYAIAYIDNFGAFARFSDQQPQYWEATFFFYNGSAIKGGG